MAGGPRVVAVSKKQPVEKIQMVYEEGIRHFGENYVSGVGQSAWLTDIACIHL